MFRNLSVQAKAGGLLLIIFLSWWLLPLFVKRWADSVFAEFNAPAWTALSYLRDLREFWSLNTKSKAELIESGIDLSRLNAAYAIQNQRLETAEREIQQLESFFEMDPLLRYRMEVARVVRRDFGTWWSYLIIRKGSVHGIQEGQGVIFSGGVVGRIRSVQLLQSEVNLISDPEFRIAAQFEGDFRPVEFRGSPNLPFQTASARVLNAPADIRVTLENPKRLVSSRLGGVFPDGLVMGTVFSMERTEDGLFQSGTVRLDPRLQTLREVAVLIPVEAEPGATVADDENP